MAVIAELSRPIKQWPLFFVPENRSGLVSPELMGVASQVLMIKLKRKIQILKFFRFQN